MDVPVVLFLDGSGEREMIIGDVEINPTLEYKPFQIMLSHKMRISPNQISVHLLHPKPCPEPTDYDRQRTRIIGKANLGLICRHKDRYFLVELKRYRRWRTFSGLAEYFLSERYLSLPPRMRLIPESMVLIRSNHYCVELSDFYVKRYYSLPPRMRRRYHQDEMITQPELAENDQVSMRKANFDSGRGTDTGSGPGITDCHADAPVMMMMMNNNGTTGKLLFCDECENAARDCNTTSFHPCVNDTVITCFTTKLGPIKRIAT